ncbi:Hydrogen peroxide-inducible protein activator [compost metagenome]
MLMCSKTRPLRLLITLIVSILAIHTINMNIQQLEYVLAVDRLKSFTKAAEYCNVTQATLSVMVKKLEDELSVMLFDRKQTPIRTTEAAHAILKDCETIVARSHLIREKTKSEPEIVEGTLKLGVIPTIANVLLPKVLPTILETYPKLHLEIYEATTVEITKQLKDGSLDAAIIATPIAFEDVEEIILYYEMLLIYGCQSLKQKFVMPQDLNYHEVWLLEEGHCLREQFINICSLRKKRTTPKNLSLKASSLDTLLNMVDTLGGLTIIPELYYHGMSPERQKKVKQFSCPVPVREVSLIYYRPYEKKYTLACLAKILTDLIPPQLFTAKYKNSDLKIISTF